LKRRLSEYVRQVRSGQGVLVTNHGEVVAELNPPDPEDIIGRGVMCQVLCMGR